MRHRAGARGGDGPGPGRLRHGPRLRAARNPAPVRGRAGQWRMESRALSSRTRLRPAAPRSRDRDAEAASTRRSAEGHGGGRDDPDRAGADQRHPRRHRPSLPRAAGHRKPIEGSARVTTLSLTINGQKHGPMDVRDDLSMNDFLREMLGMTGTKFGCGAAQCLSCAVIVDAPDGTSTTSPTCVAPASTTPPAAASAPPAMNFDGKSIRTVEGHARDGELSTLQKAFIEHFAFQCGYCTAGFLNEGQVLLERLSRAPVSREALEQTIADALDGHLCRCTGYVKYHEAVRDVILADSKRYLMATK